MHVPSIRYKRHRFPASIIAHAVWLYYRFPLSLRHVEELLLERGIRVSYETIRQWARKFGREYARRIRRKPPSSQDIWYLDEAVVSINGQRHWLWRAVDQDGYVRQVMPDVEHRSHKGLNNRAENSHLPLRKRERSMQGFRSSGSLQGTMRNCGGAPVQIGKE